LLDCGRAIGAGCFQEHNVGKGDRKTRRGKIYAGSFGKRRPKDPAGKKKSAASKKPAGK
jgi:30S ribosomal protein S31